MHSTVLFYKYVPIDQPNALMKREREVCIELGLRGRMIIATEGVNGTFCGTTEAIEEYIVRLKIDERFRDVDFKITESTGDAFPRLSIKVRSEIVTSNLPASIDPRTDTGTYLEPAELKRWFDEGKEFEIIDMRNDYEHAVGHFKNARSSGMENFKELPQVVERHADLKEKTVLTVCTGGVRCEKASAYLKSQGFNDVYQLHGGIHRYMEAYPGQDFKGTLYTFDGRVTMDWGGEREIVGKCVHCGSASEAYADCLEDTCGAHFIACDACRTEDGRAACPVHKVSVVGTRE